MGAILSFLFEFVWRKVQSQTAVKIDNNNNNNNNNNYNNKFQKLEEQMIEQQVAHIDEIRDGEAKEVVFDNSKVLLCKDNKGELSAIGSKCSHYGAQLGKGAYCPELNTVRCPLHGACFNTKSGDIEDFPGCDSLPVFDVEIVGKDIIVRGPAGLASGSRRKASAVGELTDGRLFVIVGGGASAASCAESLRKYGFRGRILILTKENHLAYDRTRLSKSMSLKIENILIRPQDFWDSQKIEWSFNSKVVELDPTQQSITLESGKTIRYDKAVVASGGDPRPLPGLENASKDSKNLYYLRDYEHCSQIYEACKDRNVIIIGSSFIGMETAASLTSRAKKITVVGMEKVPFERVLGLEIGSLLKALYESNGVEFEMLSLVKNLIVSDGKITHVHLNNEKILETDVVIVGAGVIPATSFVRNVELFKEKSIVCDKYMKVINSENLYAIGDVARFPLKFLNYSLTRIEHYGMAMYQGAIAAQNMIGMQKEHDSIPFFWSTMYGKTLSYCGNAMKYDEIIFDKNENRVEPKRMNFLAYYAHGESVVAVAAVGKNPLPSIVAQLMQAGKMPNKSHIKDHIEKDGTSEHLLRSLLVQNKCFPST